MSPPTVATVWTGYLAESRRPLASLVFIVPLLVVYEAGVCLLGPRAVRNGADVWLRQFLEWIGLGQYFLLPLLTICILLGWHYTTRQPWKVSRGVLSSMVVESLILAVGLRLILQLQGALLQSIAGPATMAIGMEKVRGLIGFLGAGVYEELLFRLILLSLVGWVLLAVARLRRPATILAIVLTSLVFAAAHYVGPYGEPVQLARSVFWFSFSFRLLAGVFFGTLFVYRGFGIAAGCHAGYDILVGMF